MNFSGIVFDLDGTLLNTLDDLANSMNAALKEFGYPEHPVEKYKIFVGNGMEKLVRRAAPPEITDKKIIEQLFASFTQQYNNRWNEFTKPYAGINELLSKLESLGIKMSVLSNKSEDFTKIIIEHYFGLNRFAFVYGARKGVPKKPDPVLALEILKLSGVPASQYLYLGDTGIDMNTANGAGMHAVGATWGFRTKEELLQNGAKTIINNPMDIVNLIV
jgi:phosphoglycolate phosphatase